MIFWGFVLLIGGGLAVLISFLSNLDMFSAMSSLGFGVWIERFFTPKYFTGDKICFFIAVVLLILALVLILRGKAKERATGTPDKMAQRSGKFFRDVKGEFGKITWPTLPDVARNTGATLVMCVVLGLVVCLIDFGLSQLITLLLSIGG